jgi:hypothetical protein
MTSSGEQGKRESLPYPRRFRGTPERNARLGRILRRAARVDRVDEDLCDLIGRRMFERDELGGELVRAMRAGGAAGVTMAQFNTALEKGIDAVDDAPPMLVRFFDVVDEVPAWVDFDLIEQGSSVIRRMGRNANDVMRHLSLIGGYRHSGPPDLLVATGGLTGSTAMRRLGETEAWNNAVIKPGAMRRHGEGFKLTVHVRAMHALVNDRFEKNGRWDTDQLGLPINRSDQAATLGLFNSTLLLGARALGWMVSSDDSLAVMHLWKYVGRLLGIDEDWLFDTEREQNRFNYHALLCQDGQTPAGSALAAALVDGERALEQGRPQAVRARYSQLRMLSLLRYFLGKESLRDLQLPVTPIWAVPPLIVKNLIVSTTINRTETGRRYLDRTGVEWLDNRVEKLLEGELNRILQRP